MHRVLGVWWLAVLVGMAVPIAGAGAQTPDDPAAETQPQPDRTSFADQARRFYLRVVADEARPDERRYSAEDLLSLATPEAEQLVVELLGDADHPAAQLAVCAALTSGARTHPAWLAPAFVDPLVLLLASERDEVQNGAVSALACYPVADTAERLQQLVARADASPRQRFAAIEVLGVNAHRFEAASALVALLDVEDDALDAQVLHALERASRVPFDGGVAAAKAWWSSRSSRTEWLADQFEVQSERCRSVEQALRRCQAEAVERERKLVERLKSFQREVFHSLDAEQPNRSPRVRQDEKLVAWLNDPQPEVTQTALAIILARLADDGLQPTGEVLSALLRLLGHERASLRLETLLIIENVSKPAVVDAVLARLDAETDVEVRRAIYGALGRLKDVRAMPVLVAAIAGDDTPPGCVEGAAQALGRIAALPGARDKLGDLVAHLSARFASVGADDKGLETALLEAMAAVADPAFRDAFVDALQSDDVASLRPAIRGLLSLGDQSQLPRLRSLVASADPLVRVSAIRAIGRLGREDADLEAVLARVSPSVESSELAQDAAWTAFVEVVGHRPAAKRIEAADRLREWPERRARYLQRLLDELPAASGDGGHVASVHRQLADYFVQAGRFDDAAVHVRALCALLADGDAAEIKACRLRLLGLLLRADSYDEAHALIGLLTSQPATPGVCDGLIEVMETYCQACDDAQAKAAREALTAMLTGIDAGACADHVAQLLAKINPAPTGENETPPAPAS